MIKINLSVKNQNSSSNGVLVGRFEFLKNVDISYIKELRIKKILIPLIIFFIFDFLIEEKKKEELSHLENELQVVNSINENLKKEFATFKKYEEIKNNLDKDEKLITTKLSIIKNLILDRGLLVQTITSIASVIPKEVWINEMIFKEKNFSIKGSSLDLSQISDFMKNLKEISFFNSINLINSEQILKNSNEVLANYSLMIELR